MKITTWNVNGLRALLSKGVWDWIRGENPDILCMQEIKVQPPQLSDEQLSLMEEDFHIYWNPARRLGYSGVATYSRKKITDVNLSLGIDAFDSEGRLIQSHHSDFILYNVYFPSGQRGKERVKFKLEFYAAILEHCEKLYKEGDNIILCGDFNTAHQEIDLRNPKQNQKTSGFLPEERAWVQKFIDHGFSDIFRIMYPEKVQYTWWSYRSNARQRNVGWRLDYFLISENILKSVKDIIIHDEILGSDHCPVSLILDY